MTKRNIGFNPKLTPEEREKAAEKPADEGGTASKDNNAAQRLGIQGRP